MIRAIADDIWAKLYCLPKIFLAGTAMNLYCNFFYPVAFVLNFALLAKNFPTPLYNTIKSAMHDDKKFNSF